MRRISHSLLSIIGIVSSKSLGQSKKCGAVAYHRYASTICTIYSPKICLALKGAWDLVYKKNNNNVGGSTVPQSVKIWLGDVKARVLCFT